MIAHHDELSLLDEAGSQVDKGRAWRHELQLALSTSIASCRMNKLTSCHNISKWISGDLDSECVAPICQRCAECGPRQCDVNTNGVGENKQKKCTVRSVSLFFLLQNFLRLYEYNISITQKQVVNASTAMSHGKMELGMRSDFTLHSSSEAPYLCLMWAVYRKRDFNG